MWNCLGRLILRNLCSLAVLPSLDLLCLSDIPSWVKSEWFVAIPGAQDQQALVLARQISDVRDLSSLAIDGLILEVQLAQLQHAQPMLLINKTP